MEGREAARQRLPSGNTRHDSGELPCHSAELACHQVCRLSLRVTRLRLADLINRSDGVQQSKFHAQPSKPTSEHAQPTQAERYKHSRLQLSGSHAQPNELQAQLTSTEQITSSANISRVLTYNSADLGHKCIQAQLTFAGCVASPADLSRVTHKPSRPQPSDCKPS